MENTIKVGLADDHRLFREGLSSILDEYDKFEVLFNVKNGKELLDRLNYQKVDVILTDLKMPEMDGFEVTKQIRKRDLETKIIVISMHSGPRFVTQMIEIGANGYLLKDATPEEVEMAILSAYRTGYYFNDQVSKSMLSHLMTKQKIKPYFKIEGELSDREIEVLQNICMELTSSEIADKLNLSNRTIEGHRKNLMDKTGAKNTVGLVLYAVKNGYFDLDNLK